MKRYVFFFLLCAVLAACSSSATEPPVYTIAQLQDNAPSVPVRSLYLAADGTIYAGTTDGIFKFDGKWQFMSDTANFGLINAITEEAGVLYAGADALNEQKKGVLGGLHKLEKGIWSQVFPATVFSFGWRQGPKDTRHHLVAATWNGLIQLQDNGIWEEIYTNQNLGFSEHVHAFAQLAFGDRTFDCLGLVNKGVGCISQTDSNNVFMLNTDGQGNQQMDSNEVRVMRFERKPSTHQVWVGTEGGGVDMLFLVEKTVLDIRPALGGGYGGGTTQPTINKIIDIQFDTLNRMWLASKDSGTVYNEFYTGWTIVDPAPANAILIYHDLILSGTDNGLKVFAMPK